MAKFRKQLKHRIFGVVHPKSLSGQWAALRNITVEPRSDPLEPIMSVTPSILSIRDNSRTARNIFILPWMLAFWLISAIWVGNGMPNIRVAERNAISYIKHAKSIHGEDYFETTKNPVALEMYNDIGDDMKMSLEEYIDYRTTGTVAGLGGLVLDIVFGLFFFSAAIGLTCWTIFFRRRAEIYFDRDRRLVYSWRFNKVLANTFDDLGLIEDMRGMQIVLCGDNAKNEYDWRRILVQPTGQPFLNQVQSNQYPLAVILQFMEQGMNAVVTNGPFNRRPSLSLLVDKQPDNFEARLNAIVDNLRTTGGGLPDEVLASLYDSKGQ